MNNDISNIEGELGKFPETYREWIVKGVTNDEAYNFYSLEWIPSDRILDLACNSEENYLPGIVPIGILFDVELWCLDLKNGGQAILCPHDGIVADLYAPSIEAWLYRICLTEASDYADEDEIVQKQLLIWSKLLTSNSPKWGEHVRSLSETSATNSGDNYGSITRNDVNLIIEKEFGPKYLGSNVEFLILEE